MTILEQTSWL